MGGEDLRRVINILYKKYFPIKIEKRKNSNSSWLSRSKFKRDIPVEFSNPTRCANKGNNVAVPGFS